MANYRLVSNATFRPFSFEEYVKPYQMYGEAYKEIETNIVDLETQAGKWDKLANEQSDPKTHATYKAYADELRSQAEQLARYGMSPDLRRRASTMRGRYAKEIEPIEVQYNKREQMRERQHQEQVASHGTLMFDNDFNNMSLDKMMDNPNMTYNFVSGEQITADVAARVLAKVNDMDEDIKIGEAQGSPTNKVGDKAFVKSTKRKGYKLEDVYKVINNEADADPYLKSVYDSVAEQYKDNPAYDANRAKPYIDKGLLTGIMGSESNLIGNPNFTPDETIRHNKASEALQHESNAISREGHYLSYKVSMKQLALSRDAQNAELFMKGLKRDKSGKIVSQSATELANNPVYQAQIRKERGNRQSTRARNWIGENSYYSVTGSPLNPTNGKSYAFKDVEKGLMNGKYHIESGSGPNPLSGKRTLSKYNKGVVDSFMKNHDLNPDDFFYIIPEHKKGEKIDIIIVPYTAMESTIND